MSEIYLTIEDFCRCTRLSYDDGFSLLNKLSNQYICKKFNRVRCPKCHKLFELVPTDKFAITSRYCEKCDTVTDHTDDEVLYKFTSSCCKCEMIKDCQDAFSNKSYICDLYKIHFES